MTLLEHAKNAPKAWLGNLPVTSRYTYGSALERFFRAIMEQSKILGTYCSKCKHTYVPATLFCERCLSKLEEWVDVGTIGKVYTYTLLFENFDGSPRNEPEQVAFISFGDGGLVHRLGNIDPEDIEIGMEVKAVFKPLDQRKGSILDIDHFEPI